MEGNPVLWMDLVFLLIAIKRQIAVNNVTFLVKIPERLQKCPPPPLQKK